jgi:mediator of RNA polymerase II transcription subunit 16
MEGFPAPQSSLFRLTHLEIITGSPDSPGGSFPPNIVAAFSAPPPSADDHPQSGPASTFVRWEVVSMSQALHPSFDHVVSKKTTTQLKVDIAYPRSVTMSLMFLLDPANYVYSGQSRIAKTRRHLF